MSEKNDTSTNERDIEGLLGHLVDGQQEYALLTSKSAHAYHAALIALLAERNSLKQRVAELEVARVLTLSRAFQSEEALRHDRDRDLRERLVESALQGAASFAHMYHEASSMGTRAVYIVDAAIAAMRKGATDGK